MILQVFGMSQNPDTKEYIIVLQYAEGGSFDNWIKRNGDWYFDIKALKYIIAGLGKIHKKKMVHRDFHIGNILLRSANSYNAKATQTCNFGSRHPAGSLFWISIKKFLYVENLSRDFKVKFYWRKNL